MPSAATSATITRARDVEADHAAAMATASAASSPGLGGGKATTAPVAVVIRAMHLTPRRRPSR